MSVKFERALRAAIFAASLLPCAASAHATLEKTEAAPGAFYKAVMRIPHGCSGSATVRVRVRIPDGFVGVKPMPKPGWILETTKGKYDQTYELYHAKLTEGVKEISWGAGHLPDEDYDEFVFIGTFASSLAPGAVVYFPTVQDCEKGAERWIEIPTADKPANSLKSAAPALTLTAPAGK